MLLPLIKILPLVGKISRIINLVKVDFPAQLAPTRKANSPLSILTSISLSPMVPFLYSLVTLINCIISRHHSIPIHTQNLPFLFCHFSSKYAKTNSGFSLIFSTELDIFTNSRHLLSLSLAAAYINPCFSVQHTKTWTLIRQVI